MKNPFKKPVAINERYGQIVICTYSNDKLYLDGDKINENGEIILNKDIQKKIKKKKIALEVDKETSLDPEKMKKIFERAEGCHVLIRLSTHEVYSLEEMKALKENFEMSKKYGPELEFADGFTFEEAEKAGGYIDEVAKRINEMEINGKKLTQFERYIAAYQEVTQYSYKFEDENESNWKSRNLNFILGDNKVDKIVCVGYASMLKAICDKINIPCCMINVKIEKEDESNQITLSRHAMCEVVINDPESKIKGVYYSDPTNDSKTENWETSVRFPLIPEDKLEGIYGGKQRVEENYDMFKYGELYAVEKEKIKNKTFNIIGTKSVQKVDDILSKFFAPENPDQYHRADENKWSDEKIEETMKDVVDLWSSQIFGIFGNDVINEIINFDPKINEEEIFDLLKENNISKEEFRNRLFKIAGEKVKKAVDDKFNNDPFFYEELAKNIYDQTGYEYKGVVYRGDQVETDKICCALNKINLANGMTKEESEEKITEIIESTDRIKYFYRPIDLHVLNKKHLDETGELPTIDHYRDLVHGYLNGEKGLFQQFFEEEQKKAEQGLGR